jgi:HD-GYP domain-containing protein (c-di-GMP phosphodiesterase class II)
LSEQNVHDEMHEGRLIKSFHHFLNMVKIHQDNNQAVKDCVREFRTVVSRLSGEGELNIQIWRGRFHIQGEKLAYRREIYQVINEMVDYFSKRGLGGLCFLQSFHAAAPEDLVSFMHLLNDSVKQEDSPAWLDLELEKHRFSWVEIFRKLDESKEAEDLNEPADGDPGSKRKEKARNLFYFALDSVKEATENSSGETTGIRKARRLAQTIVDMVHDDRSLLLQMAKFGDSDDFTYAHSVNVAFLAVCLGKHVGLSPVMLEHLAVSALFHDVGKVESGGEMPLKQGGLSMDVTEKLWRHTLIGLKKILQMDINHSLRPRIIPGVYEHHLNQDLSGYPRTHFVKKLSLPGKILHIADVYEMLTSELMDHPDISTPEEALRRMWGEREKRFDTILLKNFISMMGMYPIGSIVELDSGEMGLVLEYPDQSLKHLPLVMLLRDDGSGIKRQGERVNLADQDMSGVRKNIVRSVPFSEVGIRPSQFFQEEVGAHVDHAP